MEITSIKYLIFVAASLLVYYNISYKYRIALLALASCVFIASFSIRLLAYVLIFSLINYLIGLKITDSRKKLLIFRTGIFINLLQLILLKYASFAIDPALQLLKSDIVISRLSEIITPIGISYFTLQGIGYLINIKMGWEKPEKNVIHFLTYILFYPKFLSGPVERSNHFLPQLKTNKVIDEKNISEGLRVILFGLFKKIAIANQLAPFINGTYGDLTSTDGSTLIILILVQPVYLYFDFSGYTDIAVGISKIFGLDILPNFNSPFFSENVTNFWKRFHMSLSSWFNDYIFRQVSFRRRKWGLFASSYAVFLTFVLFGIWHGAGWNFMILGFLQALAINYEYFTKKWRLQMFLRVPNILRVWLGRTLTYLFYGISLVFFFSPDLNSSVLLFSKLSHPKVSIFSILLREIPYSAYLFIVVLFFLELLYNDYRVTSDKIYKFWTSEEKKSTLFRWITYSCVISILFVLGNQAQQFIYAQF